MADDSIPHQRTFDVSVIATMDLAQLHEFVTRSNARIELTRGGSDDRCILISAAELASLERALEILSDTAAVRDVRDQIAQLAAATGPANMLAAV
jgi:PHD/YefM family antitoxin component YafN of YafNO toxin-antitoxin module